MTKICGLLDPTAGKETISERRRRPSHQTQTGWWPECTCRARSAPAGGNVPRTSA